MLNNLEKMIGSGVAFPYRDNSAGGLETNMLLDRINQSLFILLSTRKGSRLMLPEFGSDLSTYRFDPYDRVLVEKIRATLFRDVERWEARVIIDEIHCSLDTSSIDSHTLYIRIDYLVSNTDIKGNYVYPFRLETYDTDPVKVSE